jgi:hypothetical protein
LLLGEKACQPIRSALPELHPRSGFGCAEGAVENPFDISLGKKPIYRPFSISNPLRGCNSDLAQYIDTSPTQPTFEHEDEHEDDFDAPLQGGPHFY